MIESVFNTYKQHKNTSLFGRYISLKHIEPILKSLENDFKIKVEGISVLNQNIYSIKLGSGPIKIFMWSQMHGNESTSTKALFDLLNYIKSNPSFIDAFSLLIIPMLNPDGSNAYTRVNANNVDLNRDAQELSQPESVTLNKLFKTFKPHFCINLHGQRTIFSAGDANYPATLSFLAPAENEERDITETRKKAMRIISYMNTELQQLIPNQIGRYDDGFNANCVGDAFTMAGVPTILFESGHYKDDYDREEVRAYTFTALWVCLKAIRDKNQIDDNHLKYFNIPENNKLFCDIIISNVDVNGQNMTVEIQFIEKLVDNSIHFLAKIEKISKFTNLYAHKSYNANGSKVLTTNHTDIYEGYETDFVIWKNNEILKLAK